MEGEAEQKSAIEYRAAINTTFAAVGRGGECGYSSYNLAHWNTVYDCLFLEWIERKTLAQKPMNFFSDAQTYQIDVYHSWGCYFVIGAGSKHLTALSNTNIPTLIFPFLDVDSATRKITAYMRKLAPMCGKSVPLDVTATALRVGGVQEVVNRTGDIVAGTIRGGWGGFLASVATIMEYYQQTHQTLSKGGKALAGWPDPDAHVHPPSCSPILQTLTDAQRHIFYNYLRELFMAAHFHVVDSHLSQLSEVMFASLVQYLQPFIAQYGQNHLVVAKMVSVGAKYSVTLKVLLKWGTLVSEDWHHKNAKNLHKDDSDLAPLVVRLQQELGCMRATNLQLVEKLEGNDKKNDQVLEKLAAVETTLATVLQTLQQSGPGQKRSRHDVTLVAEPDSAAHSSPSNASSTPPLTMRPASSLASLRPPPPLFAISGRTELYDLYKEWYTCRFTTLNTPMKWESTKSDRCRVIAAVAYAERVCTDEHRAALLSPAPAITSSEYAAWVNQIATACDSLVNHIKVKLNAEDNKRFTKAPTVAALENRLRPEK